LNKRKEDSRASNSHFFEKLYIRHIRHLVPKNQNFWFAVILMGFIRVKGHGNHRYAYFVEEEWTEKGPRQSVSEYLGKTEKTKKVREFQISSNEISALGYEELVSKLVEAELLSRGFEKKAKGKMCLALDRKMIVAELSGRALKLCWKGKLGNERGCVLEMNDGFLCARTFSALIRFRAGLPKNSGENFTSEPEEGEELARLVVNAGLSLSSDVFIKLYEKCTGKNLGLAPEKN